MKVLFIPLDERPCNAWYPQMIANTADIELISPPSTLLSQKKQAANRQVLWQFIEENINNVDCIIFSVDMMMYGGLIPSRLHHLSIGAVDEYEQNIRQIKQKYPHIKIYAYSCIMRCPSYSSSDEEPDYYDDYGHEIFKYQYLKDKAERDALSTEEGEALNQLTDFVPNEILADFESRREFNLKVNLLTVQLVKDKVLDFLVIPQDDSSPYGYTAQDQHQVLTALKQHEVSFQVAIYPGADEVGITLLSRAYNEFHKKTPKIYSFYSSTLGEQVIPLYEDRPMNESLKSHIRAAGGQWCDNSSDADFILAINSPGKKMEEASMQGSKDLTYSSFRNLQDFTYRIESYIAAGKPVMLADSAFANGGDIELISYLDTQNLLGKLVSYKGWNTNCNTLGSTLGAGMIAQKGNPATIENICYHILEDVGYQSVVRRQLIDKYFSDAGFGHTTYPTEKLPIAMAEARDLLMAFYQNSTANSLPQNIDITVSSPWSRTFEIGLTIKSH